MTMSLALDPITHDLKILPGARGIQYVAGADETIQRIKVTLLHFYGEYFLNILNGVPWFELILGGKDYRLAEAILRQAVLKVPGVVSLLKLDARFSLRELSIDMVVGVEGSTTPVPVFFDSSKLFNILDGGAFGTARPGEVTDGGAY